MWNFPTLKEVKQKFSSNKQVEFFIKDKNKFKIVLDCEGGGKYKINLPYKEQKDNTILIKRFKNSTYPEKLKKIVIKRESGGGMGADDKSKTGGTGADGKTGGEKKAKENSLDRDISLAQINRESRRQKILSAKQNRSFKDSVKPKPPESQAKRESPATTLDKLFDAIYIYGITGEPLERLQSLCGKHTVLEHKPDRKSVRQLVEQAQKDGDSSILIFDRAIPAPEMEDLYFLSQELQDFFTRNRRNWDVLELTPSVRARAFNKKIFLKLVSEEKDPFAIKASHALTSHYFGNHVYRPDGLMVVIPYFNPVGYRSMVWKYNQTVRSLKEQGVDHVVTVRANYPSNNIKKPKSVDSGLNPHGQLVNLDVENNQTMFIKESLVNYAFENLLTDNTRWVVWLDSDVLFRNSYWAHYLSSWLEKFDLLQAYYKVHYLNRGQTQIRDNDRCSFATTYREINPAPVAEGASSIGFSWAIRANLIRKGYRLYESCVVGGGDTVVASVRGKCSINYGAFTRAQRGDIDNYLTKMSSLIKTKGYVALEIATLFHGSLSHRKYRDRKRILTKFNFNPRGDLHRDSKGIVKWSNNVKRDKRPMIKEVIDYFKSRQEDS